MSEATTVKSTSEATTTNPSATGAAQAASTEGTSEADAATSAKAAEANKKCPFFGVRSYLHNFYEQKRWKRSFSLRDR